MDFHAWTRRVVAALAPLALAGGGAACNAILGDFEMSDGTPGSSSSSQASSVSTGQGGSAAEGSGGGATGSGGATGGGGVVGYACPPSGRGPSMIAVPGDEANGVDEYCIDSTEVTMQQYNQWLQGQPDAADQPEVCKPWNETHNPKAGSNCEGFNYEDALKESPERPMVCVNWCDAASFCQWAGKRLCGRVGGGSNDFQNDSDPFNSQWYRACSAGGGTKFPYGDEYDAKACVGEDHDGNPGYQPSTDVALLVGESGCEGGFEDLFDMSGNVAEWEDACESEEGQDDPCHIRAGSYMHNISELACANSMILTRKTVFIDFGFRCCAELQPVQ